MRKLLASIVYFKTRYVPDSLRLILWAFEYRDYCNLHKTTVNLGKLQVASNKLNEVTL